MIPGPFRIKVPSSHGGIFPGPDVGRSRIKNGKDDYFHIDSNRLDFEVITHPESFLPRAPSFLVHNYARNTVWSKQVSRQFFRVNSLWILEMKEEIVPPSLGVIFSKTGRITLGCSLL